MYYILLFSLRRYAYIKDYRGPKERYTQTTGQTHREQKEKHLKEPQPHKSTQDRGTKNANTRITIKSRKSPVTNPKNHIHAEKNTNAKGTMPTQLRKTNNPTTHPRPKPTQTTTKKTLTLLASESSPQVLKTIYPNKKHLGPSQFLKSFIN